MKWNIFIKEIRPAINNYSSEVNPADIWASIEQDVDEINRDHRRKRRLFYIFIFSGFALALGTISIMYRGNDSLLKDYSTQVDSSIKSGSENDINVISAHSSKNDYSVEPVSANSSAETINVIDNAVKNSRAHSLPLTSASISLSDTADDIVTTIDQPTKEVLNRFDTSHFKNTWIDNKDVQELTNITNVGLKDELPIYSRTTAELPAKVHRALNPNIYVKEGSSRGLKQGHRHIDHLSGLALRHLEPLFDDIIDGKIVYLDLSNYLVDYSSHKRTNGNRHQKNLTIGLGLVSGISHAIKLYGTKNITAEPLIALRKNTESSLETTHLGVQLSLRHASGLELSTGVIQTSIAERFDYNESIVEIEMVEGVIERRINFNRDTISILGQIPRTRTTIFTKKIYNTYNLYEIPIIIGYFHNLGNWRIGGQAGIYANLSLKTEGRILSSPTEDIDIRVDQNQLFKSKVGLSYYLDVSMQRTLFSNVDLSISPFVKIYSSDFTIADYKISQKYTLVGGQIGLHYWFGR